MQTGARVSGWNGSGTAPADDGERGQALIEFALCLPVLLLILFGLTMFGIAMTNYLILTDATAAGARQVALSRGSSTDPCSTASSTVISGAPNLNSGNMVFTYSLNGTAYSGTSCTGATSNMVQGATARVTVTYPCSLISFRYSYSCQLTASTAELIQ